MAPGLYRAMTGNRALAWGLLAAAQRSKVPIVYGAYPITPASSILEELALHKRFRIRTIQAEDEIAAVTAAIGASFGGAIGVTGSSGPGIALKGEAIGLAVTAELPLVIFNIQRGGPSTGLPTKTEQGDLMQALYGRNSESPVVVLAPGLARRLLLHRLRGGAHRRQVHAPGHGAQSDGFLANGSEPWLIPDPATLPPIDIQFRTETEGFFPYLRDPATLARPWARPGTPGLEHRIGGLEKQDVTGNISYDAENHDHMVRMRAEKVRRVAQEIPPTTINGPATGDLLVVGWGGTYGSITAAVERAQMTRASRWPPSTCATSTRCRPDLGHILREYRQDPGAGDQQRAAGAGPARGVPGRRGGLQPRARSAAGQRRDLRGHHPTPGESIMSAPERAPPRPPRRSTRRRTSSPTRTCAGVPAAVTTRS